jgi:hypothetical protein
VPPVVVAIATAVSAAAANTAAVFTGSSAVIEGVSSATYALASLGVTTGALYGIGAALAPKVPDPVALQTPLKQPMPVRQSAFGTGARRRRLRAITGPARYAQQPICRSTSWRCSTGAQTRWSRSSCTTT